MKKISRTIILIYLLFIMLVKLHIQAVLLYQDFLVKAHGSGTKLIVWVGGVFICT